MVIYMKTDVMVIVSYASGDHKTFHNEMAAYKDIAMRFPGAVLRLTEKDIICGPDYEVESSIIRVWASKSDVEHHMDQVAQIRIAVSKKAHHPHMNIADIIMNIADTIKVIRERE